VVFTVPWTVEQHRAAFVGTYDDYAGTHDKDVFFGACVGSTLRFVDSDGNTVLEVEKTIEGVQSDVYV
jgi:hypothetical protein